MRPLDLVARLGRWSAGRGPLYVLLAARLRRMIDDGELRPGDALPPDRTLAAALAVGRTTVVAAYDLLSQEGRIVRKQGSGTRVAPAAVPGGASMETSNPLFLHLLEPPDDVVLLTCASPNAMPKVVADAYAKVLSVQDGMGYYPAGHPALRRALAERYTRRGLPTSPEQILVTAGAQQALSLVARMLLTPGDRVLVEAPTYPGALEVFRESAAVLRSVPHTDADAFVRALQERPALAYLIPTHHNPTGDVLPALLRRRVAEAAVAAGVPVIDDEALADLGSGDLPPLAAFGRDDLLLTVGSLSKILWGGLRIGWVRAAEAVVARLARFKAVQDLGGEVFSQLAAAELVAGLEEHRERRVAELRERHDTLCAELTRLLPEWRFRPATGGQTVWVELPRGDGISFAQLALRHGVAVLPGGALDVTGGSTRCLRISFLATPEELTEAVRRLAAAWDAYGVPEPLAV
ncbi:PLP-dependent aminotransferase family protein [Amycolatopsis acidicola]|uniref:aminotransferase-like domain-containing protein n=1 Tax=Amycolatopsis acidicola TaxID=2596893 RepID=UPI001FB836BF|nr:PLP-dependent aminotransferase family protein [Amycolatopsis acidicola]